MIQMEAQAPEKFRYDTKREYERELSRLISLKNTLLSTKRSKTGPTPESVEEEYDSVMEEYLSFCSSEKDG